MFFRFVMELGICPLTGTKSDTHMQQDLASLTLALDKEEENEMRKLLGLRDEEDAGAAR